VKIIKTFLTASLFYAITLIMPAQADVREVFVCHYLDGHNMSDVMSARDFYLKQAKKAGIEPPMSFVWTPYKADTDIDVIWFSNYESMDAFAAQADVAMASPEMIAVQARFDSVVKCTSSLGMRELIYEGDEPAVADPPAIISSNACKLNHAAENADMGDLWGHVQDTLTGIDAYKQSIAYAFTPIITSPTSPDLYLYEVSDNVTSWAAKRAAFASSDASASLGRHFQKIMDCTNTLWIGERVIPIAE